MQEIVYKEGEEDITVWNFSVKWKGMVRLRAVLLGGGICEGEDDDESLAFLAWVPFDR